MPDASRTLPFKKGDMLTDYSNVAVEVHNVIPGGFGIVAFGVDQMDGQWAALKTIRPDVLRNGPHIRELFIRESLTWLGVWPHANVTIADFVTEINGMPFLVLKYAEYGSLRRHLRPDLPTDQAFIWAQHIAAGMAHLHATDPDHLRPEPIIHRDLKPENILIYGNGRARITDFGLAKTQAAVAQSEILSEMLDEDDDGTAQNNTRSQRYQTERGSALGTPSYMAPEQWMDAASAGPAADVYAFGLILGEMLIGQHPLLPLNERHSKEEWRAAHLSGQHRPLPTAFPLPLHRFYARMLAMNPEQRPTMVEAFTQLQATARQLALPVFTVPEIFPPTTANKVAYWIARANACDRFNMYAEALVYNNQAYTLAPRDPMILSSRAHIFAHQGRTEEAIATYASAFAIRPADDHRGRSVVLHQQGEMFTTLQRFAEADAAYAGALREMPGAADTWYNRAVNLRLWGEQAKAAGEEQLACDRFRQAFDCAQESWKLNAHDQDTPRLLARIGARLAASHLHAQAEEAYALALSSAVAQDDPAIWYNRALNLLRWWQSEIQSGHAPGRNYLRAALEYAEEAQRRDPHDPDMPALINAIQGGMRQAQE
jgi:serine/threonine protein kinase